MRVVRLLPWVAALGAVALPAAGEGSRQVKITIEFQQEAQDSRQAAQGQGAVIVQEGKPARGRGGLAVQDSTVKTTRTSGVFTLVQDGGTGSIAVGRQLPVQAVAWFRDYATGQGYVAQGTAWQEAGTSLVVSPTILPNGMIRVRLAPRVSYLSPEGDGSIVFNEAASEVVVPNGRRVLIGGATSGMNQVTRQVLGYRQQQSQSESSFILSATIQR